MNGGFIMGFLMIFGICYIVFQMIKADYNDENDRNYSKKKGYDFYVDACGKFKNVSDRNICGKIFFQK